MAGNQFSSANKNISINGGNGSSRFDPAAFLRGMNKDVRKRWLMVGGGATAVVLAIAVTMSGPATAPAPVNSASSSVLDTTPKGLSSNSDWRSQTGAELSRLREDLAQTSKNQEKLLGNLEMLNKELQELRKNPPAPAGGAGANAAPGSKVGLTLPAPPEPPKSLRPTVSAPAGATTPPAAVPATAAPTAPPKEAAEPKRTPARAFLPTSASSAESAQATRIEAMVQNTKKGFLPGGSFAAATMISGVEAFTGGTAQSQPQPIVLRVDQNAVLPNAANYQIKGCHVLASVWGDMSSERVFGRLATLTCVDTSNRLVLSEEVEGVLVDSDGKNGVRGELQDRQGAKLARSLLAGFAQGLSSAFGAAQSTVTQTALGATSTIVGGNTLKAGAYEGASTAANQLADFYLKQAEATMPVIAVDAGRKISVLFTKSKSLSFESTDPYRVEEKQKLHVEMPVR